MGLLDQVLTPRGGRKAPQLAPLPLAQLSELKLSEGQPEAATPRTAARMGKLKSLARMLTPRRKQQPAPGADSTPGGLINAYRPTLTGMLEAQVRLQSARSSGGRRHLTTPSPGVAALCDSDSDSASEAGTDLSSLDGFGDYARCLEEAPGAAEGQGSTAPSPAADPDPDLPSPRKLLAPVHSCTPRASARDRERAAEDLQLLLQVGELPGSRQRVARMLLHADSLGPEAFAGMPAHGYGFERCVALLLQLLLPLPLNTRSAALATLQGKLASQLLGFLGHSLERVLESEKACQRWCKLPYDVAAWLMEHGPCDRGETLFDLANLWLEQQPGEAGEEPRAALAALVWRRPLATDFLRCMAANLPWAAGWVAPSPARPPRLPPSLDGRFSFTAEFELHDLLELQAAALQEGRPRQRQSPAIYCGGYCWWMVLVANPRHNRFELYASCAAFSLFQEPFRAALQPAADVRFAFQGTTSLAEWRQTNAERLAAMHTHWGGPAFWVPPSCPSLHILPGSSSGLQRQGSGGGSWGSPHLQLAAAARPDTARGARPAMRQQSRLSVASSAGESPGLSGPPSSRSLSGVMGGAPPSARGSGPRSAAYLSDAESSGLLTARPGAGAEEGGLLPLSMDQVVAEVRRSCPFAWGASLRVRVNLKLLGGC